jgi:Family of unknown function (DUF6524)
MMAQRYDWQSVVARLLFSLLMVFSLYNPSGYSYWHWVQSASGNPWAKAFVGVLLLGLHGLLWRAVLAVLRPFGVALLVALCVCGFVALSELGLVDRADADTQLIAGMATLVVLLTSGLTLASLMHRLTGVQHVEEVPH